MKYSRGHEPTNQSQQKRRLKTQPLLVLIAILFAFNMMWFIAWLMPAKQKQVGEEVASVAGKSITREEWMTAMEKEIGQETLLNLVNAKVMEEAAKQYDINVNDKEIDLEIALIRSVDGASYSGLDTETMRQKIRSTIILEKVLSKDVVLKEKAIKKYYEDNESLFNISTSYRTSILVVPTKKEAEQSLDELKKGSSFDVLAKERSKDLASASLGGDIGYIDESTDTIDKAIVEAATTTEEGKTSDVIQLTDGNFAIISVSEVLEGQSFMYKEVKGHIKRELSLEQLPQSVSPEAFWKEFDAKWFYGK